MDSERFAASLIVSIQQTRFPMNILDPTSKEIHIKDLNLGITSLPSEESEPGSSTKLKGKAKAKSEGLELLNRAELRLKEGTHYALVGTNGSGKSTLLRAIAEKHLPGIPLYTRITILQQTALDDAKAEAGTSHLPLSNKPVLQQVVEGDKARNELVHEADLLSKAIEDSSDSLAPVRAVRQVHHERLKRDFFEVEKAARLRSGARGYDARKVLISYEKKMEDSFAALDAKDEDISEEAIEHETREAVDTLAELQSQLESMKVADLEAKARVVLTGLGFKEDMLQKPFSSLSGGWRMRCMLASALTHTSDVIVLDEPTNFLDLLGIMWLQRYLQDLRENSKVTVLAVSHDRDFVDAICDELIILKDQKLTYFSGNLSAFEKDRRHQILRMTRMKDAQDKQIAHMEKTIQTNIKIGKKTGDENKLRQAKSRQKKVDDRMGLQVSATGGRFKLNRDLPGYYADGRRAAIEIPKEDRLVNMVLPPAPELRFPGSLASLEKVTFQYQKTTKPVLQDIDLVIHMGDRVGIVGLNGCGKSTLIKLLIGETKPTRGTSTKHSRLNLGYYSQHTVEELQETGKTDPTLTALGMMMKGLESNAEQEVRGLLSSFGLAGRTASDVPIAKLSGGQLVRLGLARIFQNPPHLLVLDEITTHLDYQTVTALVGALTDYDGGMIIVSHDRFLIRCAISGDPIDPEGDSEDEDSVDRKDTAKLARRNVVFELKGGKMLERTNGVNDFVEKTVEARLKKMAI